MDRNFEEGKGLEKIVRVLWELDVDEVNLIFFISYLKGLCYMFFRVIRKVEK